MSSVQAKSVVSTALLGENNNTEKFLQRKVEMKYVFTLNRLHIAIMTITKICDKYLKKKKQITYVILCQFYQTSRFASKIRAEEFWLDDLF